MLLLIIISFSFSSFTSSLKRNGAENQLSISWSPIALAMMSVPEDIMEMMFLFLVRDVSTIATDARIKVNALFATRQRISES